MLAIQVTAVYRQEAEARDGLSYLSRMDGFLDGRIMQPSVKTDLWTVQTLFPDVESADDEWLENADMRRVMLPSSWIVDGVVRMPDGVK